MPLYLLKRRMRVDWEECEEMVVRADSRNAARKVASEHDHGKKSWLNPSSAFCEEIPAEGEPKVILERYKE